jgi:hypothetical protein
MKATNTIARVLLFLNAHQDELAELGSQISADEAIHSERYDRRVLSERFLVAMVQGAATRTPLEPNEIDRLVKTARQLTDLFLADIGQTGIAPINVAPAA